MIAIEVAIGPGGVPGTFKVEVVASPAGEASTTVELDAEALLARREQIQQAVLASAVLTRGLSETEQPVREVGQALFAGLLGTGEVAGRYRAAAAVAADRGQGLRVVLRIDTPVLAGLPWEAMYDQAAGAYVCRHDQLVCHVPVASVPAPLRVRPPLRILGVVSSPRGLAALNVEKEQDQLARALARPARQGLAELHWAPSATWADLQDLLLDGKWHVLHFIGHGDYDPGQDEGVLALTREDGRADLVAAHKLVDLLRQARPMPRLVVLNSCSGAAAGASDLFSGTAAALVRGGVSAVAAMQYEISDPAAVAFARGFYAAIARGRGVDDAVSSGRVAILGVGARTLEWVTPVLYLRGHDTCLFSFPPEGLTRPVPDEGINPEPTAGDGRGARRDQPADTSSPGAAGPGARWDSPVTPSSRQAERPPAAQTGPSGPAAAPGPSRLIRTLTVRTRFRVSKIGQSRPTFGPDGTLLLTVSDDRTTAQPSDVATGALVSIFTDPRYRNEMVFSPDGGLLATTTGYARAVQLWDVATGTPVRTLTTTGDSYIRGAVFSSDGTLLAASADNGTTAQLWDVATGAPVRASRSSARGGAPRGPSARGRETCS